MTNDSPHQLALIAPTYLAATFKDLISIYREYQIKLTEKYKNFLKILMSTMPAHVS
jgi:hypothetical protein